MTPKTIVTAKSTAATFFVANDLLIFCFDLFLIILKRMTRRTCVLSTRALVHFLWPPFPLRIKRLLIIGASMHLISRLRSDEMKTSFHFESSQGRDNFC